MCNKRQALEFQSLFDTVKERLVCYPLVMVAAINGHCFAAGLIVALLHDYRVMHDGRGWMCLNEIHLGLRFSKAMKTIFYLKFTPTMIRDVVLYGNRFTAEQALNIGLIDEVSEDGEAEPKAVERAMFEIRGRTYNRKVLSAMKKDLYGKAIIAIHESSRKDGKDNTGIESKL